jgi:hypothetical protein
MFRFDMFKIHTLIFVSKDVFAVTFFGGGAGMSLNSYFTGKRDIF